MDNPKPLAPDPPSPAVCVLPHAARRQRDVFGRAAIDPLLASLRDRLAAVVADSPEDARAAAHQLAGIAGTLGFADVADAWEGYSAEGESRRDDALRLARSALLILAQTDLTDSKA